MERRLPRQRNEISVFGEQARGAGPGEQSVGPVQGQRDRHDHDGFERAWGGNITAGTVGADSRYLISSAGSPMCSGPNATSSNTVGEKS